MQYFEIAAVFARVYKGRTNFMTPNVVTYGKRGRLLYELSSGTGLGGGPLYGVTVIEIDGSRRHDLSRPFPSKEEALAYIGNDFVLPPPKETTNETRT